MSPETAVTTLDEAWAEAEAALPGYIDRNQKASPDEEWGKPSDYRLAMAGGADGPIAWVYDPSTDPADPVWAVISADGPTPAAALLALASALRSTPASETEG